MRTIACISGTSRQDNFTLKALKIVMDELAKKKFNPILFDGQSLELAFPGKGETEDGKKIKTACLEAAGAVIATPEYHGSFSAWTKLVIENLGFPSALAGKPVALLGVAGGGIGAIKSLEHLKGVCSHIGALVVPGSVSIAGVQGAFDNSGNCIDAGVEKRLRGAAGSLEEFIRDYICPKFILEENVRGNGQPWSTRI